MVCLTDESAQHKARHRILRWSTILPLGLCLFVVSFCHGAEENAEVEESASPDLELLEFLGQFATDSGEWISPGNLITDDFGLLLEAVESDEPENDDPVDN